MNCHLCQERIINPETSKNIIESRNFAVKHGDHYICMACHEVQNLFDDTKPSKKNEIKKEVIEKKKSVPQVVKYICHKCKSSYEGSFCTECKTPNPLFARTKKRRNVNLLQNFIINFFLILNNDQ